MDEALRILVMANGEHRKIALLSQGKLMEYYEENGNETTLVNAVFLGRVENVSPGVKAAFVSIGQPLNGFLPLGEMQSFHTLQGDKPLVSGTEAIVQVKKDAKEQKGAYLTRDIALPGQTVIYMPLNRYVGISKRVDSPEERETLLAMGREISAQEDCGLILRYAALYAKKSELLNELEQLKTLWVGILKKAEYQKAPVLLYSEPSALTALVRDYATRYQLSVTCNDAVNRMPSPVGGLLWEQVNDLELEAAWRSAAVDTQVAQALSRRVELSNGGSLVIDEREALTTVDVNSGRYLGDKDGDLALTHNLASCGEIARQIRLRNVSGIVLIDFIDMKTDEERKQVVDCLETELSHERGKTVLHGFTSLGLLEMTRKRTGVALRETLQEPCKVCGATGYRNRTERDHKRE